MNYLTHVATFWIWGGLLANLLSFDIRVRPIARLLVLLIWPWMFYVEGTPTMARFLRWAKRS